jgi:hypothetical protein
MTVTADIMLKCHLMNDTISDGIEKCCIPFLALSQSTNEQLRVGVGRWREHVGVKSMTSTTRSVLRTSNFFEELSKYDGRFLRGDPSACSLTEIRRPDTRWGKWPNFTWIEVCCTTMSVVPLVKFRPSYLKAEPRCDLSCRVPV